MLRLVVSIIVFVHALWSWAEGTPSSSSGPFLELDSAYIDMGSITIDSVTERKMAFRNSGDHPLIITQIFSECGCTVADYTKEDVAPGETGEITIRFDARRRRPGPFRKALRIKSNAVNPRMVLIVKGCIDTSAFEI